VFRWALNETMRKYYVWASLFPNSRLLSLAVKAQPTAANNIKPVMIGETSPKLTAAPMTEATDSTAEIFQE
jgi:hypothetical protein